MVPMLHQQAVSKLHRQMVPMPHQQVVPKLRQQMVPKLHQLMVQELRLEVEEHLVVVLHRLSRGREVPCSSQWIKLKLM